MNIVSLLLFITAVVSRLAVQINANCVPANGNWQVAYSSETGRCYYFQKFGSRASLNKSQVVDNCPSAANANQISGGGSALRLPKLINDEQMFYLMRALSSVGSGLWNVWTEAVCNVSTSRFYWSNGNPVAQLQSVNCDSSMGVMYTADLTYSGDGFSASNSLVARQQAEQAFAVCEYEKPKCNLTSIPGYNVARMQASITPFTEVEFKVECSAGYFRKSELDPAAASSAKNTFRCVQVNVTGSIGYGELQALDNNVLESCESMHCKGEVLHGLDLQADFKESYKDQIDRNREYAFDEKIAVECVTGYVRIDNTSSVNSSIECKQSVMQPNEGEWRPIFCTPVACNESAMSAAFDGNTMERYKAYDRLKDRTYTAAETHKFPYYPNTVHVRCRNQGEFFEDRKYDKTFRCKLRDGSVLQGEWIPTEGTLESSMRCKPITCLTNEVVISSQQSRMQDYLASGNFNETFELTDENGLVQNVTIREFSSVNEYNFRVKIKVFCKTGHAMTTTNINTGRMESITIAQSQCSSSGSWDKQLSGCIKQSAAIDTGGLKKYVPEAKEAGSAQSLGAIVIVILVVFFSVIVVLDLATLSRDIKLLKQNINRLRVKIHLRKNK